MTILTLVRHGQSVYNLVNRFTGSLDIALTALGEEEARKAAIRLKGFRYSIAYTSLLTRAQETLQIIVDIIQQSQAPVVKTQAFDEREILEDTFSRTVPYYKSFHLHQRIVF